MNVRAPWLVSTVLALALVPSSLIAQASWTFRGTGEFGGFFSTRDLGKNVGGVQELVVLQVSSRMDRGPVYGGGIEAVTPDGRTMYRALVRSTLNGTASGTIALCNVVSGTLCIPREVDAAMISFLGEAVFLQGSPDDLFRQNFVLGAGLRSYQFTVEACDPNVANPDLFTICELVQDIYEDQSQVQPFLEFGFGASFGSGPISAYLRVTDIIGPYSGGSGDAEGDYQSDIHLMGGISFRVR